MYRFIYLIAVIIDSKIFSGVLLMETEDEQIVTLDVMPLINGYLPLPTVRLSKYIPANTKTQNNSKY